MKIRKKILKNLYRYFLSAALLSGTLAFSVPVKADYNTTLINDSYACVISDKGVENKGKDENYWLIVKIIADGNTVVNNIFYFSEENKRPSIEVSAKSGYVMDSATFYDGDRSGAGPVPFTNNQVLPLDIRFINVLTINLHTETQATVTQIHSGGASETSSVFSLRDTAQQIFSLTPQNGEEVNKIEVSPSDETSLIARNGNTLTITGKSGVPSLNITVTYRNPLQDTLQIQKSYGGKVNGDSDTNFWLKFDVSGNTQIKTQPLDVILVLDRSGSMGFSDNARMNMLKTELTKKDGFIDSILNADDENRIAIVDYSSRGSKQGLCRTVEYTSDKEQLNTYVNTLVADGGTQTDAGLYKAHDLLNGNLNNSKKIVILFTDGLPGDDATHSVGEAFSANAQANTIKAAGADFYTISYIPDDTDVTWNEKNDSDLYGSADIDDTSSDTIVTLPSSYDYTIAQNGSTYSVSPNDPANKISLPLKNPDDSTWLYNQKAFADSFLKALATDTAHYYDASGNIPLGNIFKKISTEITAVATNAAITDVMDSGNCHLNVNAADTEAVQWRNTGDADWQPVTTESANDIYYNIASEPTNGKGGTIVLHLKNIDAAGIQIRFKAAPNDGVYSSDLASEAAPDLATNQSARITYTDILNLSKTKTSEAGANYDSGLDTPYIYVPMNVLSITKTINKPYYDDSTLMNEVKPVQSFIFKIEHSNTPDFSNTDETFYEVIRFDSEDGNSKTQLLAGLKAGYYRITEDTGWSWKYSQSTCEDNYSTNNDGIVWFGTGVKSSAVTFQNNRKDLGWLGDVAAAVNTFVSNL